jgi:hypothetical protein
MVHRFLNLALDKDDFSASRFCPNIALVNAHYTQWRFFKHYGHHTLETKQNLLVLTWVCLLYTSFLAATLMTDFLPEGILK